MLFQEGNNAKLFLHSKGVHLQQEPCNTAELQDILLSQ